jgi:hypothetical protein
VLCPGPNAFQHSTTIAAIAMSANRYITWLTSSHEVNSTSRHRVSARPQAGVPTPAPAPRGLRTGLAALCPSGGPLDRVQLSRAKGAAELSA